MEILKRKQINSAIGKRGVFASFPDLLNKVKYVSGISAFDMHQPKPMKGETLSFIGHPNGIEIRLNQTGQSIALHYGDIKHYELLHFSNETHELHLYKFNLPPIVLSINHSILTEVNSYLAAIGLPQKNSETESKL